MRIFGKSRLKNCLKDAAEYLGSSIDELIQRSEKITNEPNLEPLWKKYNRLNEEDYRDFWANCEYIIGRQEWYNHNISIEFKQKIPKYGNYLDYGCGTAYVAFKLKKKRPDINIFLADIPETISKQFTIWRLKKNNLNFKWYDIPKSEIVDFKSKFDFIRCYDVLEHVFHPLNTVKNLERHLKSRGYFLFTYLNDPEANLSNTIPGYAQRDKTFSFIKEKFQKIKKILWKKIE